MELIIPFIIMLVIAIVTTIIEIRTRRILRKFRDLNGGNR